MSQDSDAIRQAIISGALQGVQRVRIGNQDVEAVSIDEQLKALSVASNASESPWFGLRITRLVPPGFLRPPSDGC